MLTVELKEILKFNTKFSVDWVGSSREYRIPFQTFHERRMQSTPNQYMMKNLTDVLEKLYS